MTPNQAYEHALITQIEEIEGRVPSNAEVSQHGYAIALPDGHFTLWRGQLITLILHYPPDEDGMISWKTWRINYGGEMRFHHQSNDKVLKCEKCGRLIPDGQISFEVEKGPVDRVCTKCLVGFVSLLHHEANDKPSESDRLSGDEWKDAD